jgi:hypothetical protein
MNNTIVSISEHAFFTMVTSALEAYKVDHSKLEDGSEVRLETFGNLWGFETITKNGAVIYHISSADVSTAASRERAQVIPKDDAYALKQKFVDYFFPELKFLGDYHSHPYSKQEDRVNTELDLERNELYRFSDGDFKSARYEQQDQSKDYRIGMVVTVFQRDDCVFRQDQWMDDRSCIRFQYDSLTIWLKGYVWMGSDYRKRADKKVTLLCPTLGFSVRDIREG